MEPKALNFGNAPTPATGPAPASQDKGTLASTGREPGQLVFPEKSPVPAAAAPAPSLSPVRPAPGALSFPAVVPKPQAKPPGETPLFGQKAHPARSAVQEQAEALNSELYERDSARINRVIDQLLPLTPQELETWTDGALDIGRKVSTEAATLNRRFAQLGAQAVIEEVTMVMSPHKPKFLLQRMRVNSLRDNMPVQEARVLSVKQQLSALNADLRELIPRAQASQARLEANYLALRAVRDIQGPRASRPLQLVLTSQADMLRESVEQAGMVTLLLERTLEAGMTLHADASHLHSNVASFIALAQSAQRP